MPSAPATLGPYRILDQIGKGGMGVVYRAEHRGSLERVAVKTVHVPRESQLAGIRAEIQFLSQLHHPGIVRIVGEGVDSGVPWYAMELLEGRTLEHLNERLWGRGLDAPTLTASSGGSGGDASLAETRDPGARRSGGPAAGGRLDEVLTLYRRLCGTLSYLHDAGIVHRDLKPSNVFVRPDGTPVLVDFGLVSRFGGAAGRDVLEVSGVVLGTAWYMSPEQATGRRVDARADLYSLGILLYETLTGRPPFLAATARGVMDKHLGEAPRPLSESVDELPPSLDALVLRLLAKKPAERIGYADDVAGLLADFLPRPDGIVVPAATYLYRPDLQGREQALATLDETLVRLKRGQGSLVLVSGESGVGKTALVGALARQATLADFRVVTGDGLPAGPPLHPLRTLLGKVADRWLASVSSAPAAVRQAAPVLRAFEPALEPLVPESMRGELPELPADAARRRLFDALLATITAFAKGAPLVLVLDDLQWADELTLAFLASIPRATLEESPIAIVGTYRAEESTAELAALGAREDTTSLSLERLDERAISGMVAGMLAMPQPPDAFVRFLTKQSEGNPFFVAEYLRTAVDEKVLHRADARWHVAGAHETEADFEALPLPRSVRDLVTRRLHDVSRGARELAEAASVLGRELDEALLHALVDVDSSAAASSALAELLARALLERDDAGRLRFAHDKIRETAYDALSPERRRSLHARAGATLERFAATRGSIELRYAELSRHFFLADDVEKAIDYSEKAAVRALETGAYREGEELLARVVSLDERRGARRASALTRARWQRLRSGAAFGLGDLATCGRRAEEGLALLDLPMPKTAGGWKAALARNLAIQTAHRLLPSRVFKERPERWDALSEASFAAQRLSERHYFAADALGMVTSSLLSVNLAERTGAFPQVSRTYAMLGLVAGSSGLPKLSRVYFREGKALAERTNDVAGLVYVLYADASVDLGVGDFAAAKRKAEDALERERAVGDRQEIEVIQTVLAHVAHYTGRPTDARAIFFGIRDSAKERANLQHETWGTYGASRSSILLGRLDEALELLTRARLLLSSQADHMSNVLCQALLATLYLEKSDLPSAREAGDDALRLLSQSMASVFEMYRGYAAAAEVHLAIAKERGPTTAAGSAAVEAARPALAELSKFAYRFPLAAPAAAHLSGVLARLRGKERRARRSFTKARDAAKRNGMPFEEARARLQLSESPLLAAPARDAERREANRLFTAMGAARWIERSR